MKRPNIIKLSNKELFTANQDLNFIMGYLKSAFRTTHNKEQREYLEKESSFKKILDQINKMSKNKFKVKRNK